MTPESAADWASGRPAADPAGPKGVPFDTALLRVSNCLAEAEECATQGYRYRAERLFRIAEAFALQAGYLELVRLVWAYDPTGALTNAVPKLMG